MTVKWLPINQALDDIISLERQVEALTKRNKELEFEKEECECLCQHELRCPLGGAMPDMSDEDFRDLMRC